MYKIHFDITQYHKFTLTEVENMIPFERELFLDMLVAKVEKQKQEQSGAGRINLADL